MKKADPPHRRKNGRSNAADVKPLVLDGLGGRAARDSGAPVVECINLMERLEETKKTESDRAASQNKQGHRHQARGIPKSMSQKDDERINRGS